MTIGEYVKKAREKKGITQQEMADALYVDVSLVCRWEKGRRRISAEELCSIADFLGVSLDELVGRTKIKEK